MSSDSSHKYPGAVPPISLNECITDILRSLGDPLTGVREVGHWAYFPSLEQCNAFIRKCLEAGLRLRALREPENRGGRFGACVFHADIPTLQAMDDMTAVLSAFAEECGGEYDGWETSVLD